MTGALRWRCRRGMRELDALLNRFLDHTYADLSADQKIRFEAWLDWPDPVLWDALTGFPPKAPIDLEIRERILSQPKP